MNKQIDELLSLKVSKIAFSKDGKRAAIAIKKDSKILIYAIKDLPIISTWYYHLIRQY